MTLALSCICTSQGRLVQCRKRCSSRLARCACPSLDPSATYAHHPRQHSSRTGKQPPRPPPPVSHNLLGRPSPSSSTLQMQRPWVTLDARRSIILVRWRLEGKRLHGPWGACQAPAGHHHHRNSIQGQALLTLGALEDRGGLLEVIMCVQVTIPK
jgi:hypothetical protein